MTEKAGARPTLRRARRWYAGCARVGFAQALVYKQAVWMQAVAMVLTVFLLTKIWTSVYAGAESVDGLPHSSLMVYLTLSAVQLYVVQTPLLTRLVHIRIREGTVQFDLSRPAPYLTQLTGIQAGNTAARLLMVAPAIPFAVLVGSFAAPDSAAALAGYVVTFALGYLVTVAITILVVLTAFWTLETAGMAMLVQLITVFFSGSMVPLVFFPDVLRTIADALPFKLLAYVPAAIYVGQITNGEMYRQIAIGAGWVLALAAIVWLVWRRAHRRVVIQGG